MARTYREIATEDLLGIVEEAMSQVVNWWGDHTLLARRSLVGTPSALDAHDG